MSTTTTLPVAEAMTAADLAAHQTAMERLLGPNAHVSFTTGHWKAKGNAHAQMYPTGICGRTPEYAHGDTWDEMIQAAYQWIETNKHVSRNATICRMALAVIELTDEHGKCTEAMLLRRDFSRDTIREMHSLACERAGEMAGNAPFTVKMDA